MPIYLIERRTKAERTQQTLKVCVTVYLIWKIMLSAYIISVEITVSEGGFHFDSCRKASQNLTGDHYHAHHITGTHNVL